MKKVITNLFIWKISISLLISCKITEKDITGLYRLDNFPKTMIQINVDKTFEFVKDNRNPYLHPFDHPEENYFITKGTWTEIEDKKIELTSTRDTLIYPLVNIKKQKPRDSSNSYFTFYDLYGDSVRILYVQLADNSIVAAMHRSMPCFHEDIRKQDTFEFHFYGYRSWTFISGEKENADYSITLSPEFKPRYFDKTEFRVKRKKLIDIQRRGKFRKTKKQLKYKL
jgi:hypothetical protein